MENKDKNMETSKMERPVEIDLLKIYVIDSSIANV